MYYIARIPVSQVSDHVEHKPGCIQPQKMHTCDIISGANREIRALKSYFVF